MHLDLLAPVNSRILGWLCGAGLLLLGGCASEPVALAPTAKAPSFTPSKKAHHATYNKPYTIKGKTYYPLGSAAGYREQGTASWYGAESGNRTAMGSPFEPEGISAAHKTLPLPSKVRVTNLHNGRTIDVLVNDRGPFKPGRLIDLSHGAARKLGIKGTAKVLIEYVENLAEND